MRLNKADIRGRWEIVSWTQEYDDGRVVYPMGQHLQGFIDYGPHGMFLVIERAQRGRFASGGQWSASDAEKAAAYNSYMSYAGGYEIEGDTIIHHVRHSLFPDWEGGVQRRLGSLKDGLLRLSARLEEGTEQARSANLTWRRAGDDQSVK
nr:lipocalin-like domain-containing protein [Pararobbsia alpina]